MDGNTLHLHRVSASRGWKTGAVDGQRLCRKSALGGPPTARAPRCDGVLQDKGLLTRSICVLRGPGPSAGSRLLSTTMEPLHQ